MHRIHVRECFAIAFALALVFGFINLWVSTY